MNCGLRKSYSFGRISGLSFPSMRQAVEFTVSPDTSASNASISSWGIMSVMGKPQCFFMSRRPTLTTTAFPGKVNMILFVNTARSLSIIRD
ncbi:MAG TPA: hypothetical protein PLE73_00950 [Spirochaetota bacterium]|nr:hypothetical protein [Spirochaetota bacterium]